MRSSPSARPELSHRQRSRAWRLALAAFSWTAGAVVRGLGLPVAQQVPWWIVFLVLAIAGERIDLGRARQARLDVVIACAIVLLIGGALITLSDTTIGVRVLGIGAFALAVWLLLHDRAAPDARRFARYLAAGTTLAYVWLAAAAVLCLSYDGVPAGWTYDALLHATFVGFGMTMVFCHAPMVLPQAISLSFAYTESLYGALAMLSGSLLTRLAGDAVGSTALQAAGAIGIALAVVAEIVLLGARVRRRRTK